MVSFQKTMCLIKKIYGYFIGTWFDLFRDPFIAFSRNASGKKKALILDMDWYRWSLSESEIRSHLYKNPFLSARADFIRIERSQVIKNKLPYSGIAEDNYKTLSFEGFNLWGICKASVCCETATTSPDMSNPEHVAVLSRIYGEAVQIIRGIKELFSRLKPDSVLICQGGVFDSRCVVAVARDLKVNVVGMENSMVGGYVILDNLSGQIINRHSLAHLGGEFLETMVVDEEARSRAYGFWQSKLAEKSLEHRTGGVDSEDEIRKKLGLSRDKKILLLLGQVRTDASIILDSDIYEDPVDMIMDVAQNIRHLKDTVLVVRLHPKEFSGTSPAGSKYDHSTYRALQARKINDLPNVKVVEDPAINTYTLMNMACAGITINSQAGLEMCMLGKPVLVCGNAFYGRKGFTVDLGHCTAMFSCLKFLVEEAVLTKKQHEAALNFFYLFYERCFFDKRFSDKENRLKIIFRLRDMQRENADVI